MASSKLRSIIRENQMNEDLVMATGAEIYNKHSWMYRLYYSNFTAEQAYGIYLYINKYRIRQDLYKFEELFHDSKQFKRKEKI